MSRAEQAGQPTVIVDLDGPILDGRPRHIACYRTILRRFEIDDFDENAYWSAKRRGARLPEQLASVGLEPFSEEFAKAWKDLIEEPSMLLLDSVQPNAGATLRHWREHGVQITIATMRQYADRTRDQLDALGIVDFDTLIVASRAVDGVTKAAALRESIKTADLVVWIGDAEHDVHAARAVGVPAWVVTCGLRDEEFLRRLEPDEVFAQLRDLRDPLGDACSPRRN